MITAVSPTYGDNTYCVYNSYSSSEINIDVFVGGGDYNGFWYFGFGDEDIPSLFVGGIAGFLEKDHTVNTYFIGSITPGAYALGFEYVGEIFGYVSDEENECFIEMNFYLEGTGRYNAVGVTNKTAWPEIDGTTAEQIASPIESPKSLLNLLIAGRIRAAHVSNEHGYVDFKEALNRMNSWKIASGVNNGYPIFTLPPSAEETVVADLLWLWITLPIILLSIAGALVWLFIFKKQTITFILNGKEVAKLNFRFNEKLKLPLNLARYKWFIDEKGNTLFAWQRMKLKSITLYRISKTKK